MMSRNLPVKAGERRGTSRLFLWLLLLAVPLTLILAKFRYPESDVRDATYRMLFGVPDTSPIDFATLTRSPNPNDALAAPEGLCRTAIPDIITTSVAVTEDDVRDLTERALAKYGGEWTRLSDGKDPSGARQIVYRVTTPIMRFPDILRLRLQTTNGQTLVALYSKSHIGFGDMGTNRARIEAILVLLQNIHAAR
jgi:Protein of unknown function (DUF1499)